MKKDRTGERKLMNNGQWAEIIEYNDYHNIVIQFEDGTIVNKSSYLRFTEGKIENPNDMVYGKIGEERIMNNGLKAKIIEMLIELAQEMSVDEFSKLCESIKKIAHENE